MIAAISVFSQWMLTLFDFNSLDDTGKGEAVFQKGIFVADRLEKGNRVRLYHLNSFYVEVFYDAASNRINYYHSFKSLGQLAPYICLR